MWLYKKFKKSKDNKDRKAFLNSRHGVKRKIKTAYDKYLLCNIGLDGESGEECKTEKRNSQREQGQPMEQTKWPPKATWLFLLLLVQIKVLYILNKKVKEIVFEGLWQNI